MPSHTVLVLFSYSILLAAVIGAVRYQKLPAADRPFLYVVWLALVNEILSQILTDIIHTTAINCNIYVLGEAMLFTWLFYNWGSLRHPQKLFRILLAGIMLVWVLDNLILNKLGTTNSLFRIVSSFILVFLAIDRVNQLITTDRSNLLTNGRFLISTGVIIFFTYRAIIEVFYWTHLPFSNAFYLNVYIIMDYVNLFVNLMFGLAILWIPTRQKFMLPT